MVQTLLDSIRELVGLDRFQPQIIVGDNNSQDETFETSAHYSKELSHSIDAFED